MQTVTQMLNANHQANNATQQDIARLELQVSQMATQIGEREKGTIPSQLVANPKDARLNQCNSYFAIWKGDWQLGGDALPNHFFSSQGYPTLFWHR